MYLYGMKRETRKRFKTMFHVEQKTAKMTIKQWAEKCHKWEIELNSYWFNTWTWRTDPEAQRATLTLTKFIQSLNTTNNDRD